MIKTSIRNSNVDLIQRIQDNIVYKILHIVSIPLGVIAAIVAVVQFSSGITSNHVDKLPLQVPPPAIYSEGSNEQPAPQQTPQPKNSWQRWSFLSLLFVFLGILTHIARRLHLQLCKEEEIGSTVIKSDGSQDSSNQTPE